MKFGKFRRLGDSVDVFVIHAVDRRGTATRKEINLRVTPYSKALEEMKQFDHFEVLAFWGTVRAYDKSGDDARPACEKDCYEVAAVEVDLYER